MRRPGHEVGSDDEPAPKWNYKYEKHGKKEGKRDSLQNPDTP